MTGAFDRFLAQRGARGREYGDGYHRSHFDGLSPDEEQQVLDLLVADARSGDTVAIDGLSVLRSEAAVAALTAQIETTAPQSAINLALASALWRATRDRAWQRAIAENMIGPDDGISRDALVAYVATVSATPGALPQPDFFVTLLVSEEADELIRSEAVEGILRGYGLPSTVEDQSPSYLDLNRRLSRATPETIDDLLAEARTWMFGPDDLRALVVAARAALDAILVLAAAAAEEDPDWADRWVTRVADQRAWLVDALRRGDADALAHGVRQIVDDGRPMDDAPREFIAEIDAMNAALNALAGLARRTFNPRIDLTTHDYLPEFKAQVGSVMHQLTGAWDDDLRERVGYLVYGELIEPGPDTRKNDENHLYGPAWIATASSDGFELRWLTNDPVARLMTREARAAISESEFEQLREDPPSAEAIIDAHEDEAELS